MLVHLQDTGTQTSNDGKTSQNGQFAGIRAAYRTSGERDKYQKVAAPNKTNWHIDVTQEMK